MENIINDIIHTISPRAGRAKCWLYPLEPRSTNSKSRNFYKDYRSHWFIRLYSFKYLQGIAHTASEHTTLISKHWYRLKIMQIPSYWFISAMKWFDGSIGLSSQLILFRWTLSNSNVFFMLIIFDQWRNEYCGPIGFRATKWDSSHFKPSKVLRI